MNETRFESIWNAIEDTPEQAEAMNLRASLRIALRQYVARQAFNQAEAARHFGLTATRMADLQRGWVTGFHLDTLVMLAATVGLHCDIRFSEASEQQAEAVRAAALSRL